MTPCPERGRHYRAVVFDFDGTLARLTLDFAGMRRGVAELAARFTPRPVPDDGIPLLEWLQDVAEELEKGPETEKASQLLQGADEYIRGMEVDAARKGEVFGFTRPLLASLRSAGVGVAIITRNCSPALQAAFPDALEYASCLLTRDDVQRVKPDPEHIGAALKHLGCSPEDALMVGDHPIDIATGRNAGIDSAGVASGRISARALAEAGACHVAGDCLALCAELSRNGLLPRLASLPAL